MAHLWVKSGRDGVSLRTDFQAVPLGTHSYLALKNKVIAKKNNFRAKERLSREQFRADGHDCAGSSLRSRERCLLSLHRPVRDNKAKQFSSRKHSTRLRCVPHDNLCLETAESGKQMVSVSPSETIMQKYLFVEYISGFGAKC